MYYLGSDYYLKETSRLTIHYFDNETLNLELCPSWICDVV